MYVISQKLEVIPIAIGTIKCYVLQKIAGSYQNSNI